MLQISNSIILNNSIFRKINPSFKFFLFLICIFLIFIPSGFFGQIIVCGYILTLLILARLTRRTYWNLLKTFIIMLLLFTITNWITVKVPISVYLDPNTPGVVGPWYNIPGLLWNNGITGYDNSNIFISNIYGGSIIGKPLPSYIEYFSTGAGRSAVEQWIKTTNAGQLSAALGKVTLYENLNEKESLLYILNNPFLIDGVKYNVITASNIPQEWMVANILCNPEGGVIFKSNWFCFGPLGIFRAIQVATKVILIIMCSTILTVTTSPSELTNGIEKIFSPLKMIRFPATECALILSVGIRFIPSLLSESQRILNIQAARGLDYYNGNMIEKVKALISLIIPLFSISIRKSDDLANAMDARGFNARASRTQYRQSKTTKWDYIYLGTTFFCFGIIMFMWIYKFVFMPFGIIEAALIL